MISLATYRRLRDLAAGHRGSAANVSVSRADALAVGLEITDRADLVIVPASQLVAAVDRLANPDDAVPPGGPDQATGETTDETASDESAEETSGETAAEKKAAKKPAKK